jgi:hypothetical protein
MVNFILYNILIEKELFYSKISITFSIWLTNFERIQIKISAFRRFVARQLAILAYSSKFKIYPIFIVSFQR